jgi:hypothetical protein
MTGEKSKSIPWEKDTLQCYLIDLNAADETTIEEDAKEICWY